MNQFRVEISAIFIQFAALIDERFRKALSLVVASLAGAARRAIASVTRTSASHDLGAFKVL